MVSEEQHDRGVWMELFQRHFQIKDVSAGRNLLQCEESLVFEVLCVVSVTVRVCLYHRCTGALSLEWTPQSHIPLEENSEYILYKSACKHAVAPPPQ